MKIYHNPRCSKSRQALSLIEQEGIEAEIILYKKTPPSFDELKEVISKIGLRPSQILRKSERIFREKFKGAVHTEDEWIEIMVTHPELIERPIVIKGNRAVIGRPPQNVVTLF